MYIDNSVFISVIICCFNCQEYIKETIESVIGQTYNHWEIVAINDGSTDGTENIILDYRQRGIPITYYKQKNEGFASARNKAIELARGEWIAIIDHDDLCLPDRLAIQATHIKENSNCNLFLATQFISGTEMLKLEDTMINSILNLLH